MDVSIVVSFLAGLVLAVVFMEFIRRHSLARILAETALKTEASSERLRNLENESLQTGKAILELRNELTAAQRAAAGAEERANALLSERDRLLGQTGELTADLSRTSADRAAIAAQLREQERAFQSQQQLLKEAENRLSDAFKSLSADALKTNNSQFLQIAEATLKAYQEKATGELEQRKVAIDGLIQPFKESLAKVGQHLETVDKDRLKTHAELSEQIKGLLESQTNLQRETGNLVKALRAPQVRGQWGELQLKNVVEMAGMSAYCDFEEQHSVRAEAGMLRPDMIVRMPNNNLIVVDAKTPIHAYMAAVEAQEDAEAEQHLRTHAEQVKTQITKLSEKQYWDQFTNCPEFVVLFLPGESIFSAAVLKDPGLIEYAARRKVLIATPVSLIGLLKVVAYGWRQEQLADNARKIADLGKELYERIQVLGGHFIKVGKSLNGAVECYNSAVGTLESRVLVGARRFKDLSIKSDKEIPEAIPLSITPRELRSQELFELPPAAGGEGDGAGAA